MSNNQRVTFTCFQDDSSYLLRHVETRRSGKMPRGQCIPPGKQTWLLKVAIEIVDLPIKNGDVP